MKSAAGFLASIILLTGSAAAARGDELIVERLTTAFKNWIDVYTVRDASLAVFIDGNVVGAYAWGAYAPDEAVPVASLSKAITAVCVAKLVDSGRLTFDSTLGELLEPYLEQHPPTDPRADGITVRDLVDHASGITTDPSQGDGLQNFHPFSMDTAELQVTAALSHTLGEIGTFHYNNANYALLQMIIEARTGDAYEDYCRRSVLDPVGAEGMLDPDWRVLGAYGGWRISAQDFAKVLRYFSPPKTLIGVPVSEWPRAKIGRGAYYSLGTVVESNRGHDRYWHYGALSYDDPATSLAAYFAVWDNVGFVATFTPLVDNAAMNDLGASLYLAVH